MTVKSAMNRHGALWSPCCGAGNSARSSYDDDDDSERPQLCERHTGTTDLTFRQRLLHQFSLSGGHRELVNGYGYCPADVDVVAAEQVSDGTKGAITSKMLYNCCSPH